MEAVNSSRSRVLIVSQYGFPENKRNMNAYQRILYGSRHAAVVLLLRRGHPVSQELRQRVQVYHAPFWNRWLFLVYAGLFAVAMRLRGVRCILSDPSGFAAVGFFAKVLWRYTWVLDVWDRPRWRSGEHEEGQKPRLSDRLVFWMMRHADIYLLSVLPRAAKDINPPPDRCVQLHNAIDQSLAASQPPQRQAGNTGLLEVAYAKSKFDGTLGLGVVVKATELLKERGCPVLIHLVGHLPESERRIIKQSRAAESFKLHGFLKCSRTEFFSKVHVGLVPYLEYEDLRYIFPIKALEHLSQGNPVVATRLPGLCTMVQHEYNGLVVEPGDPASLAEAIVRLQADPDLYNRLAQNALESVKKFDVEEKNRKIFETILNWRKN